MRALSLLACLLLVACSDEKDKPTTNPAASVSVPGEVLPARYPVTPVVDGDLEEAVWADAIWQRVTAIDGPPNMWSSSDADASFEVAALIDDEFLYIGMRITDDVAVSRKSDGTYTNCDWHVFDCAHVRLDMQNERVEALDGNDLQVKLPRGRIENPNEAERCLWSYGATGICPAAVAPVCENTYTAENGGPPSGAVANTSGESYKWAARETGEAANWTLEFAFPLNRARGSADPACIGGRETVKPSCVDGAWAVTPVDGLRIGFTATYADNDKPEDEEKPLKKVDADDPDDSIPTVDHHLIWAIADRELDDSYMKSSLLGQIEVVDIR